MSQIARRLRIAWPLAIAAVAQFVLATPPAAYAALQAAAGNHNGTGGFSDLTKYVNKISTDLIPVGGALAVLGLIYGGSLLMAGAPHAGRTLSYVAIGVVIVLASQGIAK